MMPSAKQKAVAIFLLEDGWPQTREYTYKRMCPTVSQSPSSSLRAICPVLPLFC
jgi:hypothetical protein